MLDKADTIFKGKIEVDRDFVRGDKHTIEKLVVNIYGDDASPVFSDEALQAQLKEYKRYLVETYKYLDFKGIDGIAEAVKGSSGLTLESVYVPLRGRADTPDGESWHRLGGRLYCGAQVMGSEDVEKAGQELLQTETEALPVEQWINEYQALVILGDPGSGKSTSMKRLALGLAQQANAPLPILLPLNAYSKALEQGELSFEDFLPDYFHAKRSQLECKKLAQLFTSALKQQKAIILMDGLDEVGGNRGEVVSQVENFVRAWIPDPQSEQKSGNRMVTTSRFVGYRDFPLRDPRWKTVALNDWNREEIGRFFELFTLASELSWSGGENEEGAKKKAHDEWQSLLQVIEHNEGIRHLSGNPLLASLLALIKRQGVTLPHRRVELYNLYMGTLLRSWNRSRSLDKRPIGPEIDFSPTQRLLAKLALHLREANPQGGLIHEDAMRSFLEGYFTDDGYTLREARDQSRSFLQSVHKYSNLLIEKGHLQYGFLHLTFEEYLAGFGLALERESVLIERLPKLLEEPKQWKETLLLAMGVMSVVNSAQEKAHVVLDELLDSGKDNQVLFAGEVLYDVGASVLGNRVTRKIRSALQRLMQDIVVAVEVRAKAGRLLSRIGDLRKGVTVKREGSLPVLIKHGKYKHALPDVDWLPVEAGKFRMGTEGEEGGAQEKPAHDISVDAFSISRYPITNAQYQCFIDAGMYENETFWNERLPEAAAQWLAGNMVGEELIDSSPEEHRELYRNWMKNDVKRLQPRYFKDSDWNLANHPVVGVSWFEALAYSVWLNDLNGVAGDAFTVRLPSEKEWEFAARGASSLRFPWGADSDIRLHNAKETGVGRTTAVGMFGDGEHQIYDMSGSVWEWTGSRWGSDFSHCAFSYGEDYATKEIDQSMVDPVEYRILRGGSWYSTSDDCRCAVRDGVLPDFRGNVVGFRVVCVEAA